VWYLGDFKVLTVVVVIPVVWDMTWCTVKLFYPNTYLHDIMLHHLILGFAPRDAPFYYFWTSFALSACSAFTVYG
jgi:hypothetical protein